jgi:hypothetical protein
MAEAVDKQLLHTWNGSPLVKHIELSGCVKAFTKSRFLPVIYDTQGRITARTVAMHNY